MAHKFCMYTLCRSRMHVLETSYSNQQGIYAVTICMKHNNTATDAYAHSPGFSIDLVWPVRYLHVKLLLVPMAYPVSMWHIIAQTLMHAHPSSLRFYKSSSDQQDAQCYSPHSLQHIENVMK